MIQFEIHQTEGELTAAQIKEAIAQFYRRHNRLPTSISTHHTRTQRARVLLTELDLKIPVHHNGGALAHELWLATNGRVGAHGDAPSEGPRP